MNQVDYSYTGFYCRYETVDKATGSLLRGPDNIVGDDFEVFFKTEDDRVVAWLKNKFDKEVAYLDVEGSRKLQLAAARNQTIRALLSFVAYTDEPDPGMYWGEVAVFCFNPAYADEMNAFVDRCAVKLGEGIRPNIDLGRSGIEKIFTEENWLPKEIVPLPDKKVGMAVLKSSRLMSEKMIEQGRNKNIGCYIISWAFIIAVVLAIAFGLHSMGLF